ncbi:MAG: hypothetical protein MR902_07100 [Campylobacter sp.]|nr:hypothetical protein [Campylobacter sp.]
MKNLKFLVIAILLFLSGQIYGFDCIDKSKNIEQKNGILTNQFSSDKITKNQRVMYNIYLNADEANVNSWSTKNLVPGYNLNFYVKPGKMSLDECKNLNSNQFQRKQNVEIPNESYMTIVFELDSSSRAKNPPITFDNANLSPQDKVIPSSDNTSSIPSSDNTSSIQCYGNDNEFYNIPDSNSANIVNISLDYKDIVKSSNGSTVANFYQLKITKDGKLSVSNNNQDYKITFSKNKDKDCKPTNNENIELIKGETVYVYINPTNSATTKKSGEASITFISKSNSSTCHNLLNNSQVNQVNADSDGQFKDFKISGPLSSTIRYYYTIVPITDGILEVASDNPNIKQMISKISPTNGCLLGESPTQMQVKANEKIYIYVSTTDTIINNPILKYKLTYKVDNSNVTVPTNPSTGNVDPNNASKDPTKDVIYLPNDEAILPPKDGETKKCYEGKECVNPLKPPYLAPPPLNDGTIRGYINTIETSFNKVSLVDSSGKVIKNDLFGSGSQLLINGGYIDAPTYSPDNRNSPFIGAKWQTNVPCIDSGTRERRATHFKGYRYVDVPVYICTTNKIRFGGQTVGYVRGDYTVTGAGVLDFKSTGGYFSSNYYGAKSKDGFIENSGENNLYLPPDIKSQDIVFARLYWSGMSMSRTAVDLQDESAKKTIKNYRKIKLKAENTPLENYEAKDEDIKYVYSTNSNTTNLARVCKLKGECKGSLYFVYSASVDVLDYVKGMIENNPDKTTIKVRAGDIVARTNGTNGAAAFDNDIYDPRALGGNYRWINGSLELLQTGTYFTKNMAGWSLVVVYNKNPEDPSYESLSKEEQKKYYKSKSVTIYDGFSTFFIKPSDGTRSAISQEYKFDGFFTPRTDDYEAKISTFALGNGGSSKNKIENSVWIKDAYSSNFEQVKNDFVDLYTQGNESITVENIKDKAIEKLNGPFSGVSLNTFDVNKYMKKEQYETTIKTSGKGNKCDGDLCGATNYFTMLALSTDIYEPKLCYEVTVSDIHGTENKFVAATGDILKNRVQIRNEAPADETDEKTAEVIGAKFNIRLDKNTIYIKNSMKIKDDPDNPSSHSGPGQKFRYSADNKRGLYNSSFEFDRLGDIINLKSPDSYPDRQFIEYDGKDKLDLFVGKDGGRLAKDENGNLRPNGGTFQPGEYVEVEYNTRVGEEYQEPKFYTGFQKILGGKVIPVEGIPIKACKSNPNKVVTIVDISQLKITNPNFKNSDKMDGKKDTLYSQISGKNFDGVLAFRPKLKTKDEDGSDIKENIDEDGEAKIDNEKMDAFSMLTGTLEVSLISRDLLAALEQNATRYAIDHGKDLSLARGVGCDLITDDHKIPFVWNEFNKFEYTSTKKDLTQERIRANSDKDKGKAYLTYQIKPTSHKLLEDLSVNLAAKNLTFMVTYVPAGGFRYDTECKEQYNLALDEAGNNEEKKKKAEDEYHECLKKSTDDENLKNEMDFLFEAKETFKPNLQGVYNVCNSDDFSIRPKYIKVDGFKDPLEVRQAGDVLLDGNKKQSAISEKFYAVDENDNFALGYDSNMTYKDPVKNMKYLNLTDKKNKNPNVAKYQYYFTGYNLSYIAPVLGEICYETNPAIVDVNLSTGNFKKLWDKDSMSAVILADFKNPDKKINHSEIHRRLFLNKNPSDVAIDDKYKNNAHLRYCDVNGTNCQDTFSYYNIGYARMKIYDDSWTYADQAKDDCVVGSTSNDPNEDPDKKAGEVGRIGCDISTYIDYNSINWGGNGDETKDIKKQFENAKFIAVPIEVPGKYKGNKDKNIHDKVKLYTNKNTYIPLKFTYDHLEANISNLANAKSHNGYSYTFFNGLNSLPIGNVPTAESINMGARLTIDMYALMANYIEKTSSGNNISHRIIPTLYSDKCFSNDVSFGVRLNFSCNAPTNDVTGIRCRGISDEGNYTGLNSVRGLRANLDMNHADKNVTFTRDSGNMTINYLKSTFKDGKFDKGAINFNFDRSFSDGPQNPIRIVAEDFIQSSPVRETKNPDGIVAKNPNLAQVYSYDDRNTTNIINSTTTSPINNYADFYFGYVNSYEPNIENVAKDTIRTVDIDTFVYCADSSNNAVGVLNCNSFSLINGAIIGNDSDKARFFINRGERFNTTSDVALYFVNRYEASNDQKIKIDDLPAARRLLNTTGAPIPESISISATGSGKIQEYIKVYTQPYFLLNDGIASDPTKAGVGNYNTFNIEFADISQWAGQGGTRGGDDVGIYMDKSNAGARQELNAPSRLRRW